MKAKNRDRVHQLLNLEGPLSAQEIRRRLAISQPTVSRALAQLTGLVLTLGSGRAVRYALKRPVHSLRSEIPLYLVDAAGTTGHVANLHALQPRGFYLSALTPTLLTSRHYDDLPWFLSDLRPSGFLGRLIPRKFPELNFPPDIRLWNADHCLYFWSMLAGDLIGNWIVGEHAFALAQRAALHASVAADQRASRYEEFASNILALGPVGSSAGGEQPKFLVTRLPEAVPVIIKFSPDTGTLVGHRRADLLVCEHIALETLKAHGIAAARSQIIRGERRVFLEVERFDRTSEGGRRGLISLAILDSEFVGNAGTWRTIAKGLLEAKRISQEDYESILWRYYFGLCITNTDMHAGNLSLFLEGEVLGPIAPVYDMLPMGLSPSSEELPPFEFLPPVLMPNDKQIWSTVLPVAARFWETVQTSKGMSPEIKSYANQMLDFLKKEQNKR